MKKRGLLAGMMLFFLAAVSILSACNSGRTTLYIYTWADYIDKAAIKQFQKETGIKVKYDTFETNEDMYIKLKSGAVKYDVMIPSEYMTERLIAENLLLPLDYENIPNAQYIDPDYKGLSHDPNDEYSVAYMFGTTGIVYNKKMVTDTVDSWTILWNEKYKGNILMQDSVRDTFLVALSILGYPVNSTDSQQLLEAKNKLLEQRPLVKAYLVDRIMSDMEANEAALAVIWSCDFLQIQLRNPDLVYVIPKEEANLWIDSFVIPVTSRNKTEAEMFIDFMCREDIALQNSVYINGPTPQLQAREKQPDWLRNNPAAYPSQEELSRCTSFCHLSEAQLKEYDRLWTELKIE